AQTGAFPADKRFNTSRITNPLAKQLYALDTAGSSIWLENYIPPEVDSNADIPAGQLIISGSGDPAAAVALWDQQLTKWRTQQPGELANFKQWGGRGRRPPGQKHCPARPALGTTAGRPGRGCAADVSAAAAPQSHRLARLVVCVRASGGHRSGRGIRLPTGRGRPVLLL